MSDNTVSVQAFYKFEKFDEKKTFVYKTKIQLRFVDLLGPPMRCKIRVTCTQLVREATNNKLNALYQYGSNCKIPWLAVVVLYRSDISYRTKRERSSTWLET